MNDAELGRYETGQHMGVAASLAVLLLCVGFAECSGAKLESTAASATPGERTVVVREEGRATFCVVDGASGPPSYRVRDAGQAGVPKLTAAQLGMLRRIRVYVHPSTLRFAFVGGKFIVFDASRGPCEPNAPGYSVLNGGCNEMYSPTDNFDGTRAVPDAGTRRGRGFARPGPGHGPMDFVRQRTLTSVASGASWFQWKFRARTFSVVPWASSGPAALHDHVDAAVLFLQHALDDQALRAADRAAVALVDVGPHDHVHQPRLVLDRQEDEALRPCRGAGA